VQGFRGKGKGKGDREVSRLFFARFALALFAAHHDSTRINSRTGSGTLKPDFLKPLACSAGLPARARGARGRGGRRRGHTHTSVPLCGVASEAAEQHHAHGREEQRTQGTHEHVR